jgi:hypothetical protein
MIENGRLAALYDGIEIPHITVYNDLCISSNQNSSSRFVQFVKICDCERLQTTLKPIGNCNFCLLKLNPSAFVGTIDTS